MGLFRRLSQWLTNSDDRQTLPRRVQLRELREKARQAQYIEQYDTALANLQEAFDLAEAEKDTRTQIDINLSRADILIAQGDYETATFVLSELRDDSEARQLNAPLAYALCSLGIIQQRQGNLDEAQALYEQARTTADAIKTDGASGRAAAHLGEIYLKQGNASYAAYLLDEAVTKLDRSGDRELLGHFLGQLGVAQINSGEVAQGDIRLKRGLDLAASIKHHAQMRELNLLLAERAMEKREYHRAQAFLLDAFKLFATPPPETETFTRLLCHLSRVAFKLEDSYSAVNYASQALPIAKKLEDDSLITMAKACLGLAKSLESKSESLSFLLEAVAVYSSVPTDPFAIEIMRQLAVAQLANGDAETAMQTFHDALERADRMPEDAARIRSDMATYYAEERQYREAITQWQHASELFEAAHQTDAIAAIHCDIAHMYDQLGDGRLATREYGVALEMLSRVEETHTRGVILANVAAAYSTYGDVESAEAFFKEAITIAQRLNDAPAEIARRANYGRLLAQTNRPQKALELLTRAQLRAAELGLDLQAAIVLSNMGLAHRLLGHYEDAFNQFQQAQSILNLIDAAPWRARVFAAWADAALAQGDAVLASKHYDRAYELAQENSMVDVLIQTIIGRINIALDRGEYKQAEKDLDNITPIARRQGHQQLLANLNEAWSRFYAQNEQTEQAQTAWETAQRIRTIMEMPAIQPDWL